MSYRIATIATLILTASCFAQPSRMETARPDFLAIEQFARLPAEEQKAGLEKFYREIAPKHLSNMPLMILSSTPADILDRKKGYARGEMNVPGAWEKQLADAAATLSAEQVADQLKDPMWLAIGSHLRTLDVLKSNPDPVATLVKKDLDSTNIEEFKRGAEVVSAIQLKTFIPALLDIYLAGGERAELAKNAMVWVHDDSLTTRLMKEVERDPKSIASHADLLMQPLAGKPAPKLLLDLLNNPDADIRLGAARALYSASDPAIAEHALRLASKEENPLLREMGVLLATALDAASFKTIADGLAPLMWDKDDHNRALTIKTFANRKDPRAAEPLLELLERDKLASQEQVTIMQALSELTDGKIRYDMHQWGPEKNRKAIQQFEAWINARAK